MTESAPLTPLHLHTIESLCADLVSGRPVGVGADNTAFGLGADAARSVLEWYRRNRPKWTSPVSVGDAEALVEALKTKAPVIAPTATPAPVAKIRTLTLKRIEAHRFAGLHAYGPLNDPPPAFVFEPVEPVTLFEGLNGSGKTSMLNAVIWCLTGQLLRPQRPPASGADEYECRVDGAADGDEQTSHKLSSVTPLPDPAVYRPDGAVSADTWVELTFADQDGVALAPIRRAHTRSNRGKLEETAPNLAGLGIDPVAVRLGTTMPGLLPFIQVGSESELGKAVAELTGLAPLVDLAAHATRARRKIAGEFTTQRQNDITVADEAYGRAQADLEAAISKNLPLQGGRTIPPPAGVDVEKGLKDLRDHFDTAKAVALKGAQDVLGEGFDPDAKAARDDLELNVRPALTEVGGFGKLPSALRLATLAKLSEDEIEQTEKRLNDVFSEADILAKLAADPSRGARLRLYARVAAWFAEHPENSAGEDACALCGGSLVAALDPVTGLSVRQHLADARAADADLLSQTLDRWTKATLGALARDLVPVLQLEMNLDLPDHPAQLVRKSVVDELFDAEPFKGVLRLLQARAAEVCDAALSDWGPLPTSSNRILPAAFGAAAPLQQALDRIDKALRFARWRQGNDESAGAFRAAALGRVGVEEHPAPDALCSRLKALQITIDSAEPITAALTSMGRLDEDLRKRRQAEARLKAYGEAQTALDEMIALGGLAEQQVAQLRVQLQSSAAEWRARIYAGAFPSTQHDLVEAGMSSGGRIDLMVGARGVAAPAQHVANASALRASLVGFFLAFWEYVLRERGGLRLLALDDPQELLDEENRERLARSFGDLLGLNAQLLVTTYDRRFANNVALFTARTGKVDHRAIHPVTRSRSTLQTSPSVMGIDKRQAAYDADGDDIPTAQDYVSECRMFIETRLGDFFDDAAYPASAARKLQPTLNDHLTRLRGLTGEPFRAAPMRALCDDAAFADGSAALTLLNKSHHRKDEIRPQDVALVATDLVQMRRLLERAHEDYRRFRRRERAAAEPPKVADLAVIDRPTFSVLVHPDLAAFTRGAPVGETQEEARDIVDGGWFEGKSLFILRNSNFGFAAPKGSVAIVESDPSIVGDRRLVIARWGKGVFARRLLRSTQSALLGLTAETPDPRSSAATLLIAENDVALHQVVGVLFDHRIPIPAAKTEAVQIDGLNVLDQVEAAYRVREESAIPLALPGQIALGGKSIPLDELGAHQEALVALCLDDGSSLFKRVGPALSGALAHLRQFESIGGLGASQVLSIGQLQPGVQTVLHARLIVGVLYHG